MRQLLVLATLACGCGGLGATVDRTLLRDITIENKLLLFDAENDVSIALDEREQIVRELGQVKDSIRDAEAQVVEAESDEERAGQKKDAKRVELSRAAGEVFRLKIDYLEELLDHLRVKARMQDELILVAQAKFELAKAKLVKKNNVRGAAAIDLADYEEQVSDYVEDAKQARAELSEDEKRLNAVKGHWLDARDKLMTKSGGGVGSPWAEDSALWSETW